MKVFREISRIADALERLAASQTRSLSILAERIPATERLEQLELSRSQFEADIEGVLMKAEGKLKAAANAEARTRTMAKSFEIDPFAASDPEGDALGAPIPPGDAEASEEEEVLHVPLGLALNDKTHATRLKFT